MIAAMIDCMEAAHSLNQYEWGELRREVLNLKMQKDKAQKKLHIEKKKVLNRDLKIKRFKLLEEGRK